MLQRLYFPGSQTPLSRYCFFECLGGTGSLRLTSSFFRGSSLFIPSPLLTLSLLVSFQNGFFNKDRPPLLSLTRRSDGIPRTPGLFPFLFPSFPLCPPHLRLLSPSNGTTGTNLPSFSFWSPFPLGSVKLILRLFPARLSFTFPL